MRSDGETDARADSITRRRWGGTGEVVRRQILSGSRCDGRALDELRPIHGEVALLPPVVHGSSLFCRGDTQALATVTVGSLDGPLSTPHPPPTFPSLMKPYLNRNRDISVGDI